VGSQSARVLYVWYVYIHIHTYILYSFKRSTLESADWSRLPFTDAPFGLALGEEDVGSRSARVLYVYIHIHTHICYSSNRLTRESADWSRLPCTDAPVGLDLGEEDVGSQWALVLANALMASFGLLTLPLATLSANWRRLGRSGPILKPETVCVCGMDGLRNGMSTT